jgi:hypothetical protein
MLMGSVAPVLAQLSQLFRTPMAEYLHRASDPDLFAARNELFALLGLFDAIGPVLEWAFGKHAFAFSNASQFLAVGPSSQALLILLWHVARSHFIDHAQVSSILRFEDEVASTVKTFEKLQELAEQNPEYRKLIQPRRIRGAIRNPRKMTALKTELHALADRDKGG